MILYSIIPLDVVFGNNNEKFGELFEIEYMGEKVQVYSSTEDEYVINRVISTSPKAFLRAELQPGSFINANIADIRVKSKATNARGFSIYHK
ncbi:MAG TPA: YlzJ-like family protein [Clostridiales bacterium]|nr:YlzJ-like family protein [Clostridiales bacterium]